MILTNHQQKTFDNIIGSIEESILMGQKYMCSLSGPAGTGKTVLISKIVASLQTHYPSKIIKLCTPTHKSLSVAKNMINTRRKKKKNFSSGTVHSYLKLKAETLEDKIVFVEDEHNKEKDNVNILIVDESSMISQDLFEHIKHKLHNGVCEVVLFVGDKIQLPPVDGNKNPVYTKIHQFELKEVVRQAENNPILKKATELRYAIENKDFNLNHLDFSNYVSDGVVDGIKVFKSHEDWLGEYIKDSSDKVISAFTNNTVVLYNDFNRKMWLQSPNPPYLVKNDEVVLQGRYTSGFNTVNNGELLTVKNPEMKSHKVLNLNYWEFEPKGEEYRNFKIKVLDPSSEIDYQNLLQRIKTIAYEHKKEQRHTEARETWEKFWKVKNEFVEIKYNYAHTIHKLQGSTYENVYLNLRDTIQNMKDPETLFRLVYVALTRAKKEVYLLT